jgi:serine/threonine protein kinase
VNYQGLTATKKSTIIFGIASGMAHLHSRGIVHCDLKPTTVLLNDQFEPVIGDLYDSNRGFGFDPGLTEVV